MVTNLRGLLSLLEMLDDVKKKKWRKLAVFEKIGGRGNLALKKGDSVRN